MKNLMRGKYSGLVILLGLFLLLLGTGKPANADLVGYWKFDEGSGTTANDSVGTNDGTIYGPQWVDGHEETALDFDGVDDYVNLSNPSSLQPSGALTISTWVYREGDGAGVFNGIATTAKKTGTTDRGQYGYILLYYPAENIVRFYIDEDGTGDWKYADSNGDLAPNTWYYLTAVWENPTVILYINAIAQTTTGSANKITYHASTESAIGQYWWNGEEGFFNGIIDEVAIYDYALSASEVWEHYQSGIPSPPGYFEAGEALNKNDALYLKSDGKVYKANASNENEMPAIGLASKDAAAAGDLIELKTVNGKVISGFTFDSEDIGKAVYVATTDGDLVVGPPAGAYVQRMGIVKTSEQLLLTIDIVDLPKQSGCRVYLNQAQDITQNVWTKIPFDIETHDIQNEFDSTTNHRFTATKAGYYQINVSVATWEAVEGYLYLAIYKNGVLASYAVDRSFWPYGVGVTLSDKLFLAANDYIEFFVKHTHAEPRIIRGTIYGTVASIHKVS